MNKEYKPVTNLWKDSEGYRYFGTLKLSSKIKYDGDDFIQLWEWVNQLQQENKQLKIQISAREEVCNRLENNWNKLKEIAKSQSGFKKRADLKGGLWFEVDDLLDKIQELEQGSD